MTVHRLDIKRKKRAILKDFFPICFIALFGSFGFAYIFNSDCISEYNNSFSSSDIKLATHSLSLSGLQFEHQEPFSVEGNYLSNNSLIFQLNDFDPTANYIFEFGNGERLEIHSPNFEHKFSTPGNYELNLTIQYPDKRPEVWTKEILIEDGSQLTFQQNIDNI
jgi:hypothetical protein